jgi:hypothetical protein
MNHYNLTAAVDNIVELNKRLTAVTEQRDGLQKIVDEQCRFSSVCSEYREQRDGIEAKLRIELRGHPDSELWGDAGLIAATMRCVDAHDEAIEQRDEWKAKFIQQNVDLGCEMMDPNGTIWDHAKKVQSELTAVTEQRDAQAERIRYLEGATNHANGTPLTKAIEQRDRLAMALQELCKALLTANPLDITELLNQAGDALQSLTKQNEL